MPLKFELRKWPIDTTLIQSLSDGYVDKSGGSDPTLVYHWGICIIEFSGDGSEYDDSRISHYIEGLADDELGMQLQNAPNCVCNRNGEEPDETIEVPGVSKKSMEQIIHAIHNEFYGKPYHNRQRNCQHVVNFILHFCGMRTYTQDSIYTVLLKMCDDSNCLFDADGEVTSY
jgi:hypothetical protein